MFPPSLTLVSNTLQVSELEYSVSEKGSERAFRFDRSKTSKIAEPDGSAGPDTELDNIDLIASVADFVGLELDAVTIANG